MVKWLITIEIKRLARHPGEALLPLLFLLLSISVMGFLEQGNTQVIPSIFIILLMFSVLMTKPIFLLESEQEWYANCLRQGLNKQHFFWTSSLIYITWFLVVLLVVLIGQYIFFDITPTIVFVIASSGIVICSVLWINALHSITHTVIGLLAPILIMPLLLPALLFGIGSMTMGDNGTALSYFAAYILFTITITPWVAR